MKELAHSGWEVKILCLTVFVSWILVSKYSVNS